MADYLTLLARRSLGKLRPVEPVRIHPYSQTMSPDGGRVEDSVGGEVGIDLAAVEPDRGLPLTGARGSSESSSGKIRSTSRSEGAVFEQGTELSSGRFEDHQDPESSRPQCETVEQPLAVPGEPPSPPNRATRRDQAGVGELLVPRPLNRRGERPDSDPLAESMELEARAWGPTSGALVAKDTTERSKEPITRKEDATCGEGERDDLSSRSSVEVSIGTIEIRAIPPQTSPVASHARRVRPKLGLDDYLAQRRRGER